MFIGIALLYPNQALAEEVWKDYEKQENISLLKEWRIIFSHDVDYSSLTEENIYVLDPFGNKVEVAVYLMDDGQEVLILPPKEGYLPSTEYT